MFLLATALGKEARLKRVKESGRQMERDGDNDMVKRGTHIDLQSWEAEVTTCPEGEVSSRDLQVSIP